MHSDSTKIRKLYKKEPNEGEISEDERKRIHSRHSFLFFLLGMAVYPNTDTSLLAQKLFSCENFTNDIMLLHNISLTVIGLFFSLFGGYYEFYIFIASLWGSLLCHVCHILIGLYGTSIHARNSFISIFFFLGIFRSSLSFTSPHIISKLFLFSAYLLFNNSRSAFALSMGVKTIHQARLNLVICHCLQAFITLVGAVWSTILFMSYKNENYAQDLINPKHEKPFDVSKIPEKFKKFQYLRYYYPRFVLFHICSVKYIFHTGLIPFLLELPMSVKLRGSISYTFGEFLGRNSGLFFDETVITKPGDSINDSSFFVLRDIPLFFLIFAIISLNAAIMYSTFTAKIAISRKPAFVLPALIISGLSYGYLISKATLGSKAILEYYSKKIPSEAIPRESKVVSEVITLTYNCSLFIPYSISKIIQKSLKKSRVSRDYILSRNFGNLSVNDVTVLLTLVTK